MSLFSWYFVSSSVFAWEKVVFVLTESLLCSPVFALIRLLFVPLLKFHPGYKNHRISCSEATQIIQVREKIWRWLCALVCWIKLYYATVTSAGISVLWSRPLLVAVAKGLVPQWGSFRGIKQSMIVSTSIRLLQRGWSRSETVLFYSAGKSQYILRLKTPEDKGRLLSVRKVTWVGRSGGRRRYLDLLSVIQPNYSKTS